MREGMQGERREGGTKGDARENRLEVHTCVHVACACANACGCVNVYARRTGRCTSCATAVDSARVRRESEDERKAARQADIRDGAGVKLLLWQIL